MLWFRVYVASLTTHSYALAPSRRYFRVEGDTLCYYHEEPVQTHVHQRMQCHVTRSPSPSPHRSGCSPSGTALTTAEWGSTANRTRPLVTCVHCVACLHCGMCAMCDVCALCGTPAAAARLLHVTRVHRPHVTCDACVTCDVCVTCDACVTCDVCAAALCCPWTCVGGRLTTPPRSSSFGSKPNTTTTALNP